MKDHIISQHDRRDFYLCLNYRGVSCSLDCPDSVTIGKCTHSITPVWLSFLSMQSKFGEEDLHSPEDALWCGIIMELECELLSVFLVITSGTMDRCVGCRELVY